MVKDYCVIDIGSNSIRMLLSGKKTLETTRLGEGMEHGGGLSAAAVARALDTLERNARAARNAGLSVVAFATSAVREARNRDAFLHGAKQRCGIDIRVLSGDEEARLAFIGAAPNADGVHYVLDVGGGSAEVVMGGGTPLICASIPAGAVRLCGLFPLGDPPDHGVATRMLTHVEAMYSGILNQFHTKADTFTAIGGTATSLAAIDMALVPYDAARVQDYMLSRSDMERWHNALLGMRLAEQRALPGIQYHRADIIIGGVASMLAFMRVFDADTVRVSESDNLDAARRMLLSGEWF